MGVEKMIGFKGDLLNGWEEDGKPVKSCGGTPAGFISEEDFLNFKEQKAILKALADPVDNK
jgi:hypothetical protein